MDHEKKREAHRERGREKRERESELETLPSMQHARARARARGTPRRWDVASADYRSVGAVLMPNVFVPMHQPLLPRSGAPALLRSAPIRLPRARVRSASIRFQRAHRGRVPHVRPYGRAEMRVTRHRSYPNPRSLHPPPLPPRPTPVQPPHPPGTARPRQSLRAFLMLNVAFCLCGCMGDSGREAVARPALFFKC